MPFNVYVTRRIPEVGLELLRRECEIVDVNPHDRPVTRAELLAAVRGRDGVLTLLTDTIDEEVMRAARGARGFANYAAGYNNIDVARATQLGFVVTNTPGVLTDATADLTWALLMAAARRIVEADAFMRAGRFDGWGPMLFLGADMAERTLGIVGAGRIGAAVARRAVGFRMKVIYFDTEQSEELEREVGARRVEFEELLHEADFISVHVSLSAETRHMFGAAEFAKMKRSAIFINTARGPIHDEAALVDTLRSGTIAAAGLDVYENEPAMAPGLSELSNVVVVPHLGSATVGTRSRMAAMAAENLVAIIKGERAPNCVNPEVYEKAGVRIENRNQKRL
jgi:lactate dehydrogenase-like 2-hydroxyacid dehydrogenase